MNFTKKFRKNKGITLIALVVTIIVLLILAGISINMLTGQNGILKRAQEAKEATRGGDVQETVKLEATNNEQAQYLGGTQKTKSEVIEELHTKGKLTNEEVAALENSDSITIGGITIDFSILGKKGKTLVQAFIDNEIKVGDYITNYNTTLNNANAEAKLTTEETGFDGGTQTYKVNANTTWRVLGLNKDQTQLVITTGSPIKKEMSSSETSQTVKQVYIKKCTFDPGESTDNWKETPYLYLGGAEGWYNTNDELVSNNILDKVCGIYAGKYASTTKSMRIEDINLALGLTLDKSNNKLYKTADTSKTEIAEYQGFFGTNYTYKIGDYAPENYLKAKYPIKYTNLANKKAGNSVAGTAFAYQYTSANIVDKSSKLYEVLFDGTEEASNGKSYWLASSGVHVDGSDFCGFGPGAVIVGLAGAGDELFATDGYSTAKWLAVRPVVYLQSGVTVDDLSVSSTGREEKWTTTLPNSFNCKNLEYGQITE